MNIAFLFRVRRKPACRLDASLLNEIWERLKLEYFQDCCELNSYTITWSTRRQKRTLGSCNISKKKVVVARELHHPNFHEWLEPLIYHEMCHAVLGKGVQRQAGKRAWHGKEFKILVARHPRSADLKIWMLNGGWSKAVRSDRARSRWLR